MDTKIYFGIMLATTVFLISCGKKDQVDLTTPAPQASAATQSQMPSQTTATTEKTLIGILISADEGDESCSLKIRGQDKKEVQATATFELCTERFKEGKTYKFNYEATEVPDCDCQGNQACYANCKKTVTQIQIVDGTPLD